MFKIDSLRQLDADIKARLSEKRYAHTLGVKACAIKLAKLVGIEDLDLIEAAAMLHDITKEFEDAWHIDLIIKSGCEISDSDLKNTPILHSYSAPIYIKKYFSEFATEDVLSAVEKHTVGSPDMSVFDEVIFIADYIEDGRTYDSCVNLRKFVFENMRDGDTRNNITVLHRAVLKSIDETILNLIKKNKVICVKSILTRNSIIDKI